MTRPALIVFAVIVAMTITGSLRAQEPDTKTPRAAVDAWLRLIDAAQYPQSWDEAASGFKSAVTSEMWQNAVKTARGRFGALKSRTLKSATPATKLPGAPEGEYVVFQFDSIYEQSAAAAELVTAVLEKDGSWRVAGYFIK